MTGIPLLITFVAAITLMVVSISRWKIHPFLALIAVSLLLAIVAGLPLDNIPGTIGRGFAGIFNSIALVIIFGMLIGLILEKTGGAVRLADSVLKIIGPKHPQLAILIIGWIISIPVFCDSGFIIVNPIRKSLVQKTRVSSVSMTLALAAGLFASHVFIPPTPGPIAAAGMVGLENDLLIVIGAGVLISLPALVSAYLFARHIGKKVKSSEDLTGMNVDEYEKVMASFGKLPGTFSALMPILVPVILMGIGSVAPIVPMADSICSALIFLGKPVIALMAGFVCAIILLIKSGKQNQLYDITQDSLKTAGPIIFITAAGSVLGTVIAETGFVQYIQDNAAAISSLGVFFPFIIAAVLKSSQGSSTVAITTTASIMGMFNNAGSMMSALGMTTPFAATLVVMAIGAGAMTVSHANDSYFWVVTNFGGLSPQDGYRTHTMMTLVMGVSSILTIFVLSLLF